MATEAKRLEAIHQLCLADRPSLDQMADMKALVGLFTGAGLGANIYAPKPQEENALTSLDHFIDSAGSLLLVYNAPNIPWDWLAGLAAQKILVVNGYSTIDISNLDAAGFIGILVDGRTSVEDIPEHWRPYCGHLPNPIIDTTNTADEISPKPREHPGAFYLLAPGDFSPDEETLLATALARLILLTETEVHLIRVTDDGECSPLLLRARALGVDHRVHLRRGGHMGELEHAFAATDLCLLGARSTDGEPMAFEAATRKLPILCFGDGKALAHKKACELGLAVDTQDPKPLAATLATLIEAPRLRRALVLQATERLRQHSPQAAYRQLQLFLLQLGLQLPTDVTFKELPSLLSYRIEGPFDSSYSLALVNRSLAVALQALGYETGLRPVEASGDYPPDQSFIATHPQVGELAAKGAVPAQCVLRFMYPLRLTDMGGVTHGLSCYGWEESALPHLLVQDINSQLHLVTTMSEYVGKLMIDNGVIAPVFNTGIGADHILEVVADSAALPDLGAGLRFLHISSCFPRKGVDLLLEAYGDAFTGKDHVSLVIKTFPNPHHDIDQMLACWRQQYSDPPQVVVINKDIDDGALRALYELCHVLVAPSRGEGFGLPLAEAMLHHLPVIATGYGGQMEFCRNDTAWLLNYCFAPADTHMELADSLWVEPDRAQLEQLLTSFYRAWKDHQWPEFVGDKLRRAHQLVSAEFSWSAVAERTHRAVGILDRLPSIIKRPKLGVVSTWNSKCGVASYTRLLISPSLGDCLIFANDNADLLAPDDPRVVRCWTAADPAYPERLVREILDREVEQVLIQFNFGFFSAEGFRQLLAALHDAGVQTFVTCHSTTGGWQDDIPRTLGDVQPELGRITRIFVHSCSDLNYLRQLGLAHNTTLFPHGVTNISTTAPSLPSLTGLLPGGKVIASFGFLLPHKGLLELIQAFAELVKGDPKLHLLLVNALYPAEISFVEAVHCRNLIRRLNIKSQVTLITDFLEESESLAWLSQADIIVYPYQQTSESASGAVRWGLATGKPVYCTPLDIFADVRDAVTFLPGIHVSQIAEGLDEALKENANTRAEKLERQRQWLAEHDWYRLSRRLKNILFACHQQTLINPLFHR